MELDEENARIVAAFAALWPDGDFDLDRLRTASSPPSDHHAHRVRRREDARLPAPGGERPIRLYWPRASAPTGVLVYFHGGGFVSGDLETSDGVCCRLTELAECVTLNVDYRLAPEHPFPAGLEDACAAVAWTFKHAAELGAPQRVAVGGDSAGGTLATGACMVRRDRGGPQPLFQLLFYPGINLDIDTPRRNALGRKGYVLTPELIGWLNSFYCATPEGFAAPYCTPARFTDLSGLPSALLIAGDCDPVCFESARYAERLRGAGVDARYSEYAGATHGFFGLFDINAKGRAALKEGGEALRAAFARQVPGESSPE
ncbi:MAG TPA: alpha/beta hydrolase [Phenylobacterium sp.]|nr:alpha/beta hydrolase [Phenylobacterium sp.]